jgi:translation initiation factor 2B subunit (eIF-2B alpha/beta/delta family)
MLRYPSIAIYLHHARYSPSYGGHDMARSLSSSGISTFLVPDSSIYALMSRVSKVILGAHAILTNGGMFALTGSLLTATAARAHSTTVMVCAGQFKLTPLWNLYHEYGALDFDDPSGVLGFEEGDLVDKVDVVNPYYDYVRPELVDVYVTNEYAYLLLLPSPSPLDRHPAAAITHHRQCTGKSALSPLVYLKKKLKHPRLIKESYDDEDNEL